MRENDHRAALLEIHRTLFPERYTLVAGPETGWGSSEHEAVALIVERTLAGDPELVTDENAMIARISCEQGEASRLISEFGASSDDPEATLSELADEADLALDGLASEQPELDWALASTTLENLTKQPLPWTVPLPDGSKLRVALAPLA